jgi:hypothetical protein
MKPGKLYRFTNFNDSINLWNFVSNGKFYNDIKEFDILMLVKVEIGFNGYFDLQFLCNGKIGWILFPYRSVEAIKEILEEVKYV